MVDVNVNCLVTDIDPSDISASQLEKGSNAGPETWRNATEATRNRRLLKADERDDVRRYFKGFGAWSEAEIKAWKPAELDALVLQYAAGDLRALQGVCPGEGLGDIDWTEAEKLAEAGTVSGNLYVHEGKLYISLSE